MPERLGGLGERAWIARVAGAELGTPAHRGVDEAMAPVTTDDDLRGDLIA